MKPATNRDNAAQRDGQPAPGPGAVLLALGRDLRKLPQELQDCAEAAAALQLARSIDDGAHVVASSRQLAALMTQLRTRAQVMTPAGRPPVPVEEPEPAKGGIGDLTARIAARRGSAAG